MCSNRALSAQGFPQVAPETVQSLINWLDDGMPLEDGSPSATTRICDVCGKPLVPYYGTWVCPDGLED